MADRPALRRENTRWMRFMGKHFGEVDSIKTFGAMKASGVTVVVVKAGTTKERDLERLVEDEWKGHFDLARPI